MPLSLTTYRLATRLIAPLLPRYLARRAARGKERPDRLAERFGYASARRPEEKLIWVHAASMGETMSSLILVNLLAQRPKISVLLTTGTITSARLAAARAHALHQFVPLDTQAASQRFLDHWRPDLAIFIESEIWPNLLTALDGRAIPRLLLNARLSPRSARRWARAPAAARILFGGFAWIAAQSAQDAAALHSLGIRDVLCWGNLKFSAPPLPDHPKARASLAALSNRWFLAASTHEGEEAIILATHRRLLADFPDLITVIAPRHPERASAIIPLAGSLPIARRSQAQTPKPGGIYLADTLGELGLFYRLCPIALIGGSLMPVGGHNMIEAAQLGCAILTGPHIENFIEIADHLRAANALLDVTPATLTNTLADLLSHPDRVSTLSAASEGACAQGAELPWRLASRIEALL
jgi:3-deoxy-D-manno-octulosonic-acid transferase